MEGGRLSLSQGGGVGRTGGYSEPMNYGSSSTHLTTACLRDALRLRASRLLEPATLRHLCDPARLCTYALSAPQQAAHTHGVPSQPSHPWLTLSVLPRRWTRPRLSLTTRTCLL